MNFLPSLSSNLGGGPSMYNVRRFSVAKLIVQTAGTYNDQWRRPMASHATGKVINMVENALASSGNVIDPLQMAAPAFEFLQPTAQPESPVQIVNGWGTERLRFLLHVVTEDNMGVIVDHYYTGFSEYSDPSYSGLIDPNMIFTINGNSATKQVRRETMTGVTIMNLPVQHSQILTPQQGYQGPQDPNKVYSLRPETVVDEIMSMPLRSMGETFSNTGSYISAPTASSRANNAAPNYMSKLLASYQNSAVTSAAENQGEISQDQQLEHVKKVLEDATNDRFLAWLQQRRVQAAGGGFGNGAMLGFNQFNIADLEVLDPGCSQRIKPAEAMGMINNFHQRGQTSDWAQSTAHAQFATMLAQSLPSYMTPFQFGNLIITATNMGLTGEIEVLVPMVKGANNSFNLAPLVEAFKQRLRTELFTSLSYGNSMPFMVEVKCDLMGETWVTISLNQTPAETFVCPTFCDSLFAPMMTQNKNLLEGMSNDFKGLFDLIDEKVITGIRTNQGGMEASFLSTPVASVQMPSMGITQLQPLQVQPISVPTINPNPNPFGGNNNPGF